MPASLCLMFIYRRMLRILHTACLQRPATAASRPVYGCSVSASGNLDNCTVWLPRIDPACTIRALSLDVLIDPLDSCAHAACYASDLDVFPAQH
jgi:hypothetical protein